MSFEEDSSDDSRELTHSILWLARLPHAPLKTRLASLRSAQLEKEGEKLKGRLESGGFVGKAPENVVQKVREELEGIENQITKIRTSLAKLS